jgi:hypothetical protein
MKNSIYSKEQLSEFETFIKLLANSETGSLSLNNITEQHQNINFHLITEINKTYNLFTITAPFNSPHYTINTEGRKAAKKGINKYISFLEKEHSKPDKHNKRAFIISIIAISFTVIQYIENHTGNKSNDTDNYVNFRYNNSSSNSLSIPINITLLKNYLVNDTNFIKKVSEKIK